MITAAMRTKMVTVNNFLTEFLYSLLIMSCLISWISGHPDLSRPLEVQNKMKNIGTHQSKPLGVTNKTKNIGTQQIRLPGAAKKSKNIGTQQTGAEGALLHTFEQFMLKYGKNYTSPAEKMLRFKIFKENMERVKRLMSNKKRGSAMFGVTKFADLTSDEFMATYTKGRTFSLPNVKKDHVGRRAPGSVCSTCGDDENSRRQESGRLSVTSQAAVSQETASQQGGFQEMVPPGHMTMETGSLEAGSLEAGSIEAGSLEAGPLEAGSPKAESLEAGSPKAESEVASPPPPVIGFDWRNVHPYPPCMAQRVDGEPCNACWAVAPVEAAEILYTHLKGTLKYFSVQEIVDCQTEASGCDGGTPQKALDYLTHTGVTLAENYPYVGRRSTGCQPDHPKAIKLAVWGQLRNDAAIAQVLDGRSPIPSGYFMHPDIQLFTGGVFDPPDCKIDPDQFNHASTIVAHDAEAWILRNSWGPDWNGDVNIKNIKVHVFIARLCSDYATADQVIFD